jgi:hypothetical protein
VAVSRVGRDADRIKRFCGCKSPRFESHRLDTAQFLRFGVCSHSVMVSSKAGPPVIFQHVVHCRAGIVLVNEEQKSAVLFERSRDGPPSPHRPSLETFVVLTSHRTRFSISSAAPKGQMRPRCRYSCKKIHSIGCWHRQLLDKPLGSKERSAGSQPLPPSER